jgi:hypothetical protein
MISLYASIASSEKSFSMLFLSTNEMVPSSSLASVTAEIISSTSCSIFSSSTHSANAVLGIAEQIKEPKRRREIIFFFHMLSFILY